MRVSGVFAGGLLGAAALVGGGSGAVYAQTQSDAAAVDDPSRVSEVIVTAQRRGERLQDVPIAVSVVDSATLERANVTSLTDVPALVPGLIMSAGTGSMLIFLRGVGSSATTAGNEASIPIYVDGVYTAHLDPAVLKLNNIERVEVLKGPQGTLFGRNSTGGLIQVITKTPTPEGTVDAQIGYANYDALSASAYLSGGVAGQFASDLSLDYRNQADGWGTNLLTGQDVRKEHHILARSKTLIHFGDDTQLTLTGSYINAVTGQTLIAANPVAGTSIGNPKPFGPAIYPHLADFYDIYQNRPLYYYSQIYEGGARLEHDFSFAKLVSISSYRRDLIHLDSDGDMTPLRGTDSSQYIDLRQVSEELQLLSQPGGPLDWAAGVYYLNSLDRYPGNFNWGASFAGGNGSVTLSQQLTRSYAGYAQATWHITPSTGLIAGIRDTRDDVAGHGRTDTFIAEGDIVHPEFVTTATGATTWGNVSYKKVTWKAGLEQKLAPEILAYATVSTGYKAGLFNIVPFSSVPLKPETNTDYELGLKSELLGGRVRLNVAAFWNDESNLQVQQSINTNGVLAIVSTNAAKARARGIDLDSQWRVTQALTADLSVSYLDGVYTSFPGAPTTVNYDKLVTLPINGVPTLVVPGCSTAAVGATLGNGGNVSNCSMNATGNRLPRAPEFSGNFGLDYRFEVPTGTLDLAGNAAYTDHYYFLADNKIKQPSYMLFSASIRYGFSGDTAAVQLWGKNLSNAQYFAYMSQFSGSVGDPTVPGEPRTFGVTVSKKF